MQFFDNDVDIDGFETGFETLWPGGIKKTAQSILAPKITPPMTTMMAPAAATQLMVPSDGSTGQAFWKNPLFLIGALAVAGGGFYLWKRRKTTKALHDLMAFATCDDCY